MFLYDSLQIGGIETYLVRLIRELRKSGNRVIWLSSINRKIDKCFIDDVLDGYVEIIDTNRKKTYWIDPEEISFEEDEIVTALAFDPIDFLRLEDIKKKYKNTIIHSIYWVPHFKGRAYFVEEFLSWPFSQVIKGIMSDIIREMEINNNIFYLNESHANAYMERYNYKIENLDSKLDKGNTREVLPFDDKLTLQRSLFDEFNIISIGRFDFPHKAYILGLIKTYGEIKKQYDKLKLTIIGYGKHEERVKEEISKLSLEAQKDINLVGKVAYDDLRDYYKKANLNIGVASTIPEGALTGLISIPVRHYCEECEGYGYLPESKYKITSSDAGIPIKFFIEEVINMDKNTYYEYSRKSYDAYADINSQLNITSILDFENKDPKKTVSPKKFIFIKYYGMFLNILRKIKNDLSKKNINIFRVLNLIRNIN